MLMPASGKSGAVPIDHLKFYYPKLPYYGVLEKFLAQMEPIHLE